MKNEYEIAIVMILYLIPAYLMFRGILYRFGSKISGEDNIYKYLKYYHKIGLLPDPKLSKKERMEWSKYWYVYVIISFVLSQLLLFVAEKSLISKMTRWITSL